MANTYPVAQESFCKTKLVVKSTIAVTKTLIAKHRSRVIVLPILKNPYPFLEGRTGGAGLWHGSRTETIEDHGSENFVLPNHEN